MIITLKLCEAFEASQNFESEQRALSTASALFAGSLALHGKHCGVAMVFLHLPLGIANRLINSTLFCRTVSFGCWSAANIPCSINLPGLSSDYRQRYWDHCCGRWLIWRCENLDRLRIAMRMAPSGGKSCINDDGTTQAMSSNTSDFSN